jgi:GNAT superfamily N-acetyltransferase
MLIRPAKPSEGQLIVDLIRDLAIYEKEEHLALATLDQINAAFFCQNPAVFCDFVEDESGKVVGFATWFLNFSTWTGTHGIYLEDLFVEPSARGKGYGKALLVHLAKICVERGYHRFQWWVLDWNKPSIDFYLSIGAVPQDEWTVMRVDGPALEKLASS